MTNQLLVGRALSTMDEIIYSIVVSAGQAVDALSFCRASARVKAPEGLKLLSAQLQNASFCNDMFLLQ